MDEKTAIRANFGMYNDLQDALGYRADQNAPFNPVYSVPNFAVSKFPIDPSAPVPATAKLVPGGVQPNMYTPTLISWSLRVERELSANTSVTVGYVGSHGYHELIGIDANEPVPTICPTRPCPARLSDRGPERDSSGPIRHRFSSRLSSGRSSGPFWQLLHSRGFAPCQSDSRKYLDLVFRRRKQLQRPSSRRSSSIQPRSLIPRDLTFAKSLDDGDSLNQTTAGNAPGLASNPLDLATDKGLATFDVKHLGVINVLYSLPFGRGQAYGNSYGPWANNDHQRLVDLQHFHCAIRISFYSAAEL